MKKTIQLGLLLMFALTAFTYPLLAQDAQKDVMTMTKSYEDAYNKGDARALTAMYTKDATRTNANGTIDTGSEAIGTALEATFKAFNSLTVSINQDKAVTNSDGTVTATGTYHVKGTPKTGEPLDATGSYTNTLVKENGAWKISNSVLDNK